jgi:hypothetical protein
MALGPQLSGKRSHLKRSPAFIGLIGPLIGVGAWSYHEHTRHFWQPIRCIILDGIPFPLRAGAGSCGMSY